MSFPAAGGKARVISCNFSCRRFQDFPAKSLCKSPGLSSSTVCSLRPSFQLYWTFKSLEKEDAPVEVKKKMQHRAEEQKGTTRNPSTPTDVQALHLRVPHKKDVICWQRLDLGTQI